MTSNIIQKICNFFSITRTFFSHSSSEQFWKQNGTILTSHETSTYNIDKNYTANYQNVWLWYRFNNNVSTRCFSHVLNSHSLSDFSCSDWIEWQPDEKKRIRILDLLESVRKTTLRKSASSAGCTSSNAITTSGLSSIRSPKTSGASLSANEETGRALRLHHCRQHSHSLRNLSSPTGLSISTNFFSNTYEEFPLKLESRR